MHLNNLPFNVIKQLPSGVSGDTFLATHQHFRNSFTNNPTKCILKCFKPAWSVPAAYREFYMLQQVASLNKPKFFPIPLKIYRQNSRLFLLQHYIDGEMAPTLHKHIMTTNNLSGLKRYIKNILKLTDLCNSKFITHLDIKPPNIITNNLDNTLAFVDFGSARSISHPDPRKLIYIDQPIGTYHYAAPEIFHGEYNITSDIYSIGKILQSFDMDICPDGNALLNKMLQNNPRLRPYAAQLLKDPWFS